MPNPNDYKNKEDFIQACIPIVIKEGNAKDDKQAVAICNSMWDKKEMKLETVNLGEVEIFETGTWKGQNYTEKDIDDFIQNFKDKVAEPYITIDHSSKATAQFKDALKALALGFVDKLERRGNKLVAWFKQVPKTIADLIDAGALKKKSIEFYRDFTANGRPYKNVLQGVTFHGANGLPEVNTLSDFLTLYKSNLQTMDKKNVSIVSIENNDKEVIKPMENIELKKDEYQELLKKASQVDVFQSEVNSLKEEFKKVKETSKTLNDENEKLKKEHADYEKARSENLKREADEYISKKINDGFIKPAFKDRYVAEYVNYKSDEIKFKNFVEDIESRGKVIDFTPTPGIKTGGTENFKYEPEKLNFQSGATINYDELNSKIEAYKKANSCTWEEAAIKCGVVNPEDFGKEAGDGTNS